nr:alpha-2-macroglobulin-like protein 1 [Vanessa tameamea]
MCWFIVLFILPAQANFIETPQNITSSPCSDRYHLFLAPGVLTAGGTSRTCISRFYPEGSARMVLTLVTEDGERSSATRDLPPGDGGCLDISVPEKPNSRAELSVNIRYPEAKCSWDRRISLRIASGKIVVVHTDRARYRPGDLVRIRAIVLKADLTPAHSNFEEIWVSGPGGAWGGAWADAPAWRWARVRSRLGVAQAQARLDAAAPPGRWTLRARLADGALGSTSFLVGNYELPPFQLTVRHAPRILRTSERLAWTVCVRYPWSEAVEGMLVIRLRGVGGSGEGTGGIRTAVRLKAPRACHRHAAASKRIGLDGDSSPDVVVADFSFQEEGTRIWQNTTVVSHVVDDPVTLEFLTKHRVVISPGLPYKIKVKATRWDDKPAANESVRLCWSAAHTLDEEFNSSSASCVDSATDGKGIARVMFTADDDGSPYYIFQAQAGAASARLRARTAGGGDTLVALEGLARWRDLLPSPSNVTVGIRSGSRSDALQLTADSTVPKLVKLPASQQISVAVEGPGCALVQATRTYHSVTAPGSRGTVRVRVRPRGAFHCAQGACYCAALLQVTPTPSNDLNDQENLSAAPVACPNTDGLQSHSRSPT